LWVATSDGISSLKTGLETRAELVEPIYCLEQSGSGDLWAGSASGLQRLASAKNPASVASQPLIALAFDTAGQLYGITNTGELVRARPSGDEMETIADLVALAGALPRDLAIDSQGTIWFATEVGLGSLRIDGTFELATAEDRLLSSDVRAVDVGTDDLIWVATAKGLARRRPDGRWTRFTTESTEGGLRSMEMWNLTAMDDGVLWMATAAGISRREPENADWSYFDLPDARHVLPDGSGGVWVGTRSGLYRVSVSALVRIE
jgi:ligand-binding sensor domain-containing protein